MNYKLTLERMRTVGTQEEFLFRQALEALRSCETFEETLDDAVAAIDRLVADPHLFSSSRAICRGAGGPALLGSLGFAATGDGGRVSYQGQRTPIALRSFLLELDRALSLMSFCLSILK